jgi:exosortase
MRNGWTRWHLWGALAMVLVAAAATLEVWRDLLRVGLVDEEASSILLAPLAVAWLVWVRRRRFRQCSPGGKIVGTGILALGWLAWSYGYTHSVHTLWQGGAVLIVVGALLTVVGKDVLWKFLPAFGALVFLIPVTGPRRHQLAAKLELMTTQATQSVCLTLGMPMDPPQGNVLSINGREVVIQEACNGMRMIVDLALVSYVFAFITPLRGYVRALILVLTPLTAVVCNVIRLVPTVWMFGYASQTAAYRFHDASGWVMLVTAFLLQMGVVRLLRWALVPVSPFTLAAA